MPAKPRTILFLCSGNYYRSRFAEELFNDLAKADSLPFRAVSRGLSQNFPRPKNPGTISVHTIEALEQREVQPEFATREPRRVEDWDFEHAYRVVAMSELEHRPKMAEQFPHWAETMEYWEVGDIPLETPATAIPKIDTLTRHLIAELAVEVEAGSVAA